MSDSATGLASDLEYVSETGQQKLRLTSPLYLFVKEHGLVENTALWRWLQATYISSASALSSLFASDGGGAASASLNRMHRRPPRLCCSVWAFRPRRSTWTCTRTKPQCTICTRTVCSTPLNGNFETNTYAPNYKSAPPRSFTWTLGLRH